MIGRRAISVGLLSLGCLVVAGPSDALTCAPRGDLPYEGDAALVEVVVIGRLEYRPDKALTELVVTKVASTTHKLGSKRIPVTWDHGDGEITCGVSLPLLGWSGRFYLRSRGEEYEIVHALWDWPMDRHPE
jgi:hypothetical protein